MNRAIALCLAGGILGGCNLPLTNKQKVEARKRWYGTRASVMCGVGGEHLKVGDLDKAKSSAVQALALDKDCLAARILLGKVLLEQGRYVEAAEALRQAEPKAPKNPEIPYLLGVALEKRGEYLDALRSYQKARALDPSNDAYVTASAEVLVAWGKPKLALELLETRLARKDGNLSMLALAGELAMLTDQPDKAVGFYQRCLDGNAKHLAGREGLAKAYFFAGKYAESLEALRELDARSEQGAEAAWMHIMMGNCHMALKRPAEAQAAYHAASRIEPADCRIWVALAKAAMVLGDAPMAALAARRAISLESDSVEAEIILAWSMLRTGVPAEAAKILARQARSNPEDATVLCMLGRCYASMGRKDQAVSCYVRVLRSDPEHRLAKRLLATTGLAPAGLP